jgi:hypothetical protein
LIIWIPVAIALMRLLLSQPAQQLQAHGGLLLVLVSGKKLLRLLLTTTTSSSSR